MFSLVPVTGLLLLLAGAEVVLRLVRPEEEVPLTLEQRYDGVNWLVANRSYLKKYFPADSPSIPEFKSTLFRKEKLPETFRVLCLGGSTMFGTPYDMNANIGGIVRKQLRRLLHGREVEVINWAASAINSNQIRDFAPRLLAFKPDLVLVYMGHNEFYGPGGVGASWLEKNFPRLARWIGGLQLIRLIASWVPARAPAGKGEAVNLMRQVSRGGLVSLESADADRIVRLFRENLRAIIGTFQEAKVPVILSDVSSNLMFPPFVSDSLQGGESASRFAAIREAVLQRQPGRAIQAWRELTGQDTLSAAMNYWAGRAALLEGDTTLARHLLTVARDQDLLKFRAPSPINAGIREVAAEMNVPLVPADSILASASDGGIPGDSLFWEHLHPTLRGYYLLAGGFLRAMVERGVLPEPVARAREIPLDPDSLSVAWLELAYADVSIGHLTGHWPFEDYVRRPEVLAGADPAMMRIVMDTYNRVIPWNEGCYRSATYFWSRRDFRNAETTYEALIEDYPYGFYANYLLGALFITTGETERAIPYFARSIASNPEYPQARIDLGLCEVNRGEFDSAIEQFQTALRFLSGPDQRELRSSAYYGLGAAYANKREFSRAVKMLDRALEEMPGNASAARLRGQIAGQG